MTQHEDSRLIEAKAVSMQEIVDRIEIAGLKRVSGELVGPCPLCGGRDRFAINLTRGAFLCRQCDLRGGDGVALVQGVLGLGFKDALTWLMGDAPAHIDPAEIERRRVRAAEAQARRDKIAEDRRRQARRDAVTIWRAAEGQGVDHVAAYLRIRGIVLPSLPKSLRFLPDHPYVKMMDRALVTMHRGPCMVAAIQGADGKLSAVHQTWLDTSAPKGKARISHLGENCPAKLVRGSKKGGAIRLSTPPGATVLVMGEGIETTATALAMQAVPGAAYWAGVDLGNMSGRQQKVPGTRASGWPDMSDSDAWVPPQWVEHLIYIQDGDSDAVATRAKCMSGLRRAMAARPGLRAQLVHAGDGVDLNDVLMAQGGAV